MIQQIISCYGNSWPSYIVHSLSDQSLGRPWQAPSLSTVILTSHSLTKPIYLFVCALWGHILTSTLLHVPQTFYSASSGRWWLSRWKVDLSNHDWLTCLSLRYHMREAAGRERKEVQLTCTSSPTWYLDRPPVMVGTWSGRSGGGGKGLVMQWYK